MPNRTEMTNITGGPYPSSTPIQAKLEGATPNMLIPFSEGETNTNLTSQGNHGSTSEYVKVYGFGRCNALTLYSSGFRYNTETQNTDMFLTSNNASDKGSIFAFTTLTDILRVTIYWEAVLTGTNAFNILPYVAIAISDDNRDTFTVIPETITYGSTIPANAASGTTVTGVQEYITVNIKRGMRIVIISGFTSPGSPDTTMRTVSNLKFSGGIALF